MKTSIFSILLCSAILMAIAPSASGQSCAPGMVGCSSNSSTPQKALLVPKSLQTANASASQTCTVPGSWTDSSGRGAITVNQGLTGSVKFTYCNSAHSLTITLQGTTGFFVTGTWSGGPECQSFTETMTFASDCASASGPFTNADGGSGQDTWVRNGPQLAITPAKPPTIPTSSRVDSNHHVLTESKLSLNVTQGGQPAPGVTVTLQSDRGSDDVITNPPSPTDNNGDATGAKVDTRKQPGTSTITSASADLQTATPGVIEWLPAHYESSFLVTCYVISLESDFVSTPLIGPVPGLPATARYHRGFINDVRLQGSGSASDGTFIHYDGRGRYSVQNCALMSNGECAVDGTSAAVDGTIIPRGSQFSIAGDGTRSAQDTGGAINGYHIDEFFGTRRAACLQAGRRTLGVDFLSY